MTIAAMLTADLRDITQWDAVVAGSPKVFEISSDVARTGSYSFKMFGTNSSGAMSATKNISASATYYFRVCFYAVHNTTYNGLQYPLYIQFSEGATNHISITVFLASGITVYRNGTATWLGTANAQLTANTWYCLEGYVKIHDTTGEITLKLDGTTILTLTNQDTRNAGSVGTIDKFALLSGSYFTYFYFDDIIIRDDAWPGRGGIKVLVPTGDGSTDNWTASTGNQYECVDDNPPNDYTDYVSTDVGTVNTIQLFGLTDLTGTYNSIPVVGVVSKAKLDGAGSGNIRNIIKSNGTQGSGGTVGLSTSSKYCYGFFTVNPDGSAAWTKAAVDALEAGVETI